jgi:hypothetical protein
MTSIATNKEPVLNGTRNTLTVPDALDLTEHARLAITTPPIAREES